ncbi:unnamed protein product, partial [Scytosiphon promiscuus]
MTKAGVCCYLSFSVKGFEPRPSPSAPAPCFLPSCLPKRRTHLFPTGHLSGQRFETAGCAGRPDRYDTVHKIGGVLTRRARLFEDTYVRPQGCSLPSCKERKTENYGKLQAIARRCAASIFGER